MMGVFFDSWHMHACLGLLFLFWQILDPPLVASRATNTGLSTDCRISWKCF